MNWNIVVHNVSMTQNRQILSELKRKIQECYPNKIQNVILFGSQAIQKQHEFSDYDILILFNTVYSSNDENTILDICYDIDLKYDILIDAHLISTDELDSRRGKQPIFVNALKNGIYA